MLENIEPFRDVHGNCLEDIIISLARWKKREYILMFANAWNFGYCSPHEGKTLAERLSTSRQGMKYISKQYLLQKYLGIKMVEHDVQNPHEALNIIKDVLGKGLPVAIYINAFWCNWNTAFLKYDIVHFCLATDINENEIICMDPYFNLKRVSLPIENYIKGFGRIIEFHFMKQNNDENWHEIISDCVEKTISGIDGKSDFNNMRLFSQEIIETDNLKNEFSRYDSIEGSTLLLCINSIGLCRKNNARVFYYLEDKYKVNQLGIYAKKLDKAYSQWMSLKNLFIKYKMLNYSPKFLSKIYQQINNVADYEESLAREIMEYLMIRGASF